ncbi:hypothetical protein HF998_01210 [Cellulomonas hominis]|nr:hypothetical protein [Cellulomonas hominis]
MIFADPTDLRASARYWEHAAVVMPCGRVLDIEGVRTRREWKQRWGAARVTVVSSSAAIRADWIGDQERLFTTQTAAVAARLLRGITREKHAAAHP